MWCKHTFTYLKNKGVALQNAPFGAKIVSIEQISQCTFICVINEKPVKNLYLIIFEGHVILKAEYQNI